MDKAVKGDEMCGARERAHSRLERVDTVPSATPILQLHVNAALRPEVTVSV